MAKKIVSAEDVGWMVFSGWSITNETTDGKYEVIKTAIDWCCSDGMFWFRLFSHGVWFKDTIKHPSLCGGAKKCGLHIWQWQVKFF